MVTLDRPPAGEKAPTQLRCSEIWLVLTKNTRRLMIRVSVRPQMAHLENLLRCSVTVGIGPIASQAEQRPHNSRNRGVLRKATDHRSGLLLTHCRSGDGAARATPPRPLVTIASEITQEGSGHNQLWALQKILAVTDSAHVNSLHTGNSVTKASGHRYITTMHRNTISM